jgi:glycosyltransferase involved in cell wall biosynthesis
MEHVQTLPVMRPRSLRRRRRWMARELPRQAHAAGADVVFVANGLVSGRLAAAYPTVATTNNMLPFTPNQLRHFPLLSRMRLKMRFIRGATIRSLRRTDRAVLHSQHALRVLSEDVADLPEKTEVVLTGVPEDARLVEGEAPPPPPQVAGKRYFFYLSPFKRYKNHAKLIQAYELLLDAAVDPPELFLAGYPTDRGWLRELQRQVAGLPLAGRVHFLGEVERDQLRSWMHHATVNLFPSLCETASIIQAEVLGLGGVLACSDVPPMSEVAAYAAEYFDPESARSIAAAMARLSADEGRRDELRRLAARRAAELSWDDCGRAIWTASQHARRAFRERAHT